MECLFVPVSFFLKIIAKVVTMRLLIYKRMAVTLFVMTLFVVQNVECGVIGGYGDAATSRPGYSFDQHGDDFKFKESRQISELFAKEDVRRFLITLRTFLMGVRNFAEALGGFVPSNQHISEKNAMISKYGGIFNAVRIASGAVQYVTKYLEDLLIKEIEANSDARQMSSRIFSIFAPIRHSFHAMRSMAAQVLSAYNYYSPEISFTQCVQKYLRSEFPGILPEISLPNTVRALRATYQSAYNYFSNSLVPDNDAEHPIQIHPNHPEIVTNDLDNRIQYSGNSDYRQSLYELYNKTASTASNLEGRATAGWINDGKSKYPLKRSPSEILNLKSNSIFNFDDAIAERFGVRQDDMTDKVELGAEQQSFGMCTQQYALQVLWRLFEGFIMSEDWKLRI